MCACLRYTVLCTVARATHSFIHSFISFHFISFHFISFHFISFHFISFHFISFHFISFHFISFHFISFHFISFHFISFHFISFHFISFHFISFHFISFHFISFHFISFHCIALHCIALHFISLSSFTQHARHGHAQVKRESHHTRCTQATFPQVVFAAYVSLFLFRAPRVLVRPPSVTSLMRVHFARMSSLSLVRDALWERALASQPEPLGHALRVAGLDDPSVLMNYPRNEDIKARGLEVPSGAASPARRSTSACDSTAAMPSITATGSGSAASPACGWTLVTGGDPSTGHASFMPKTGGDPRKRAATQEPTMLPCVQRW